tara:strand:+ start:1250 stop:1477 length:228 start_codon:yes stop_codon:yes gene_type:complete
MDNIYESKINTMKLKIYSNQSNQIIFEKLITEQILNEYNIQITDHNFTEYFETEILSDILVLLNINSDSVYYELK